MVGGTAVSEALLSALARGIQAARGVTRYDEEAARGLAGRVWAHLQALGPDAFPCWCEVDEMRFVCQWEEEPPVLTVMVWDGLMWQDIVRLPVPPSARRAEDGAPVVQGCPSEGSQG